MAALIQISRQPPASASVSGAHPERSSGQAVNAAKAAVTGRAGKPGRSIP